jgi:hypothetical protein
MFLRQLFLYVLCAERINPVYPFRTQTVHVRRTLRKGAEAGQQFFLPDKSRGYGSKGHSPRGFCDDGGFHGDLGAVLPAG